MFLLWINYMYVKVKKSLLEMYVFIVCMWFKFSVVLGVGMFFFYVVFGQVNELVFIEWGNNFMEIFINDKVVKLFFVINDGKWYYICIIWIIWDGVWEVYQDGMQGGSGENLVFYYFIKFQGVLVLGQEQDILGGGFDVIQVFVGELVYFNIWDCKLIFGEVYNLVICSIKVLFGNVIVWVEFYIEIYGGVIKWIFEVCCQIN